MDTLGNELRMIRIYNGFSQEELAMKIGCSMNTVSRWERGLNIPSVENLCQLTEIMKVSFEIRNGQIKLSKAR